MSSFISKISLLACFGIATFVLALSPLNSAFAIEPVKIDKLTDEDSVTRDNFGWAVSVSGDTLVVGVPHDDDDELSVYPGFATVFQRNLNGDWVRQIKLTDDDGEVFDYFGHAVSVSGDTLVVGAPGDDEAAGSVMVFQRNLSGDWDPKIKLTAGDGVPGDQFGRAVSVWGDTLLVGAPGDLIWNSVYPGFAVVFQRNLNGDWVRQIKLTDDDGEAGDHFGRAVSVWGDTLVVGAPEDDDDILGTYAGSVVVFQRIDGSWQQTKLKQEDGHAGGRFGNQVSVSGDTLAIGASARESVFIFQRNLNGEWIQQTKLTDDDGETADFFGRAVSLSGDILVVGSPWDDKDIWDDRLGSAVVFQRIDGNWQQTKLRDEDGENRDMFGIAVSVSGDTLVVGAYVDDDDILGEDAGSATVYLLPFYRCKGFAPPMADSPVRFKRNKAIPLRAELFSEAQGIEITDDDLSFTNPPIVQVWRHTDDPNVPAEDVSDAALPVGTADEGNEFYFIETDTGYWQFILDGRNWSSPGRYEVLMDSGKLSDYLITPTCITEFVVE